MFTKIFQNSPLFTMFSLFSDIDFIIMKQKYYVYFTLFICFYLMTKEISFYKDFYIIFYVR